MVSLNGLVSNIYEGCVGLVGFIGQTVSGNDFTTTPLRFIEIPITGSEFYIPVFAKHSFINYITIAEHKDIENIVVPLYYVGNSTRYVTADSILKAVFQSGIDRYRLVQVKDPKTRNIYYATKGALFSKNFDLLAVAMWKVNLENNVYKFTKPIFRITPSTYLSKGDSIIKYTHSERFIQAIINTRVDSFFNNRHYHSTKIAGVKDAYISYEIDYIPFNIRDVATPTIDTSSEMLRQLVIDNLDDIANVIKTS